MTNMIDIRKLDTVIYIPSTNTIFDFVKPDGLTHYGNKTLEQVKAERPEYADAVLMPYEQASALHSAAYRSPVSEITQERYWEMLEILPPCKWQGMGDAFESFHVSERLTANIVAWFMRLGQDVEGIEKARYFTLSDDATLTRDALRVRVASFVAAQAIEQEKSEGPASESCGCEDIACDKCGNAHGRRNS